MTMVTKETTIAAGQFKAKCLGLLDDVARTGKSYTVTKRGKPIAQVVPMPRTAAAKREPPAKLKGSILFEDDIVSPTGEVWDVDR